MPQVCPRCGTQYDDPAQVCWPCRVRLVPEAETGGAAPGSEGEPGERAEPVWVDYRPVYLAPDEFTALAVQCLLTGSGIESRVRSEQIPWTDGIMRNIIGYWGQVLVPLADVVRARALVDAYLQTLEQKTPDQNSDQDPGTAGGADGTSPS
jgi:hypothetical protein